MASCATSEFNRLFDPNMTYEYFKESKKFPFHSEFHSMNKVNTAWLADRSMLSYCEPVFVKQILFNAGFNNVIPINENGRGTQGFIASTENIIFVVFRGTEIQEIQDILFDADLCPELEGGGKVHKGYKSALESLWPDVSERLNRMTQVGIDPYGF